MMYEKKRFLSVRIAFTLSFFAVLLFIFLNSLAPASASAEESLSVFSILKSVLDFLPFLTHGVVRKLAHFSEYALLGAHLFFLPIVLFRKDSLPTLAAALFCGIPIAFIDEGLQLLAPGRHASLLDCLIDFSGVCFGFFAFTFLFLLLAYCKRKGKKVDPCRK